MDLHDRLNWQQACTVLGCSKSTLYRLVAKGHISVFGAGERYRWYSREECLTHIGKVTSNTCQKKQ